MTMPIRAAGLLGLLLLAAAPAQAILGGTATSSFAHVSNGVQITDNWVLTARHVGGLGLGGLYRNGYGSATIAARYDLGSGAFPADDLALLRLALPIASAPTLGLLAIELQPGVLTTPLAATIASGSNQLPRGFAVTGITGVVDRLDPDGTAGARPLVDVAYLLSINDGGKPPIVQGGDSGGGLFLGAVADSTGALLMGISSAKLSNNGVDVGSAFVQLASHRSWIDNTMAGDLADNQVALWLPSAVPEPANWALLLAGGAVLAVRRRATRPAGQGTSLP